MISYEVPLGLTVLTIIVMFGSLSLSTIVERQAHYWLGFIPAWIMGRKAAPLPVRAAPA